MDLLISPGKLSKAHADLSGIKNCSKCHTKGKRTDAAKCLDCHKEISERIKKGKGYHRDKGKTCLPCHPDHYGADFKLIDFDKEKFDHKNTGYSITGLHKKITECKKCHTVTNSIKRERGESYLIKNSGCIGCHKDVHKGSLGNSCDKCHSVDIPFNKAKSIFDHSKTNFPLKGKHLKISCKRCHKNNDWKGLGANKCSSCHKNPHKPAFRKTCSSCHSSNSWKIKSFNHNRTRYPLRGRHSNLKCSKCHDPKTISKKIPFKNCASCHKKDPHKGQFKKDCKSCHQVWGFKKIKFNHNQTKYPLRGKHSRLNCKKCHEPDALSRKIPFKNCTDCHKEDPHKGQFKKDCKSCHQVWSFKKIRFSHKNSNYPLEGKHKKVSCNKCHFSPVKKGAIVYKPLDRSCVNCHKDIHLGQFKKKCGTCHSTKGFKGRDLIFKHNEDSGYLLEGKHAKTGCKKCHRSKKIEWPAGFGKTILYKPLDTKCYSCHKDYHSGQLDLNCKKCHSFKSFKNTDNFDHDRSRFKLGIFHHSVKCKKCHPPKTKKRSGKRIYITKYKPLEKKCNNCHKGFKHSTTAFPLEGSHKRMECDECHNKQNPNLKKFRKLPSKSMKCTSCHKSPHPGTYGRCLKCHDQETWRTESWL